MTSSHTLTDHVVWVVDLLIVCLDNGKHIYTGMSTCLYASCALLGLHTQLHECRATVCHMLVHSIISVFMLWWMLITDSLFQSQLARINDVWRKVQTAATDFQKRSQEVMQKLQRVSGNSSPYSSATGAGPRRQSRSRLVWHCAMCYMYYRIFSMFLLIVVYMTCIPVPHVKRGGCGQTQSFLCKVCSKPWNTLNQHLIEVIWLGFEDNTVAVSIAYLLNEPSPAVCFTLYCVMSTGCKFWQQEELWSCTVGGGPTGRTFYSLTGKWYIWQQFEETRGRYRHQLWNRCYCDVTV